jgi:hypothetical protein
MKTKSGRLKPIIIRIMSEAYDLADRDDSEGYNSVKVMCSDVLAMIETEIAAEREACAKVCEEGTGEPLSYTALKICLKERNRIAKAIRARGDK